MSQAVSRLAPVSLWRTGDPGFWNGLEDHSHASLFSSRSWIETIAGTYGFSVSAVNCPGRSPVAAVLFTAVSDLRGERVISFPFCDYCDPLVEDVETWDRLVELLLDIGRPLTFRCLRNSLPAVDSRFTVVGRAAWHGVDLSRLETDLWAGLPAEARSNVRRAQRGGLSVRVTQSLDDLRRYYDLHLHVRKYRFRLLAQPWELFERLHAAFAPSDRLFLLLAERDGRCVAGDLMLVWRNTLYGKFAAAVDRTLFPSDLMSWEAIRLARRLGLACLDWGASDHEQPGLVSFKRKYATEERELLKLRWEPPGYTDARAELGNLLLGHITQLLTDPSVPDAITRLGGDSLYGQFC
jgi:CelD/BcsL family acetyltransferase involved in cellulose biosynthesis